jgi:hypothetical protein
MLLTALSLLAAFKEKVRWEKLGGNSGVIIVVVLLWKETLPSTSERSP